MLPTMHWPPPVALPRPEPGGDVIPLLATPQLAVVFTPDRADAGCCPICGVGPQRVFGAARPSRHIGVCSSPPADEVVNALRWWCHHLGLDEAAAVMRRHTCLPPRPTPPGIAPLGLAFGGHLPETADTRSVASLQDLAEVVELAGPIVAERIPARQWRRFLDRLLVGLWP